MGQAMTALRPISLPLHGAFELLLGIVALVAPFALGFTAAGAVVSVLLGVLAIGLALDATQTRRVATHHIADYGIAFAAVALSLPLAIVGDAAASLVLAAVGIAQLGLNASTRYSARA